MRFLAVACVVALVGLVPATSRGAEPVPAEWSAELTREARVLGGWSAGAGGLTLGLLAAQPFRPPRGPSAVVGSVVGWGPTLVGFAAVMHIRRDLQRKPLSEVVVRLRRGFVVTAVWGGIASAGAHVLGAMSVPTLDIGGGVLLLWFSVPASLVAANIACGVNLGRALRVQGGLPPLKRGVQLVAAGPTGFVLRF